jgi:hypothetical protein
LESTRAFDNIEDENLGAKKRNLAFLDQLLMAQERGEQYMSNKDIRDEVSTFMFEVITVFKFFAII